MFLLQKMHGKQITESLDLPYHEPTRQQAGYMEAEVTPFSCFKCKRDCGDGSKLVFDQLLLQSLLAVQSGPSCQREASSSGPLCLLAPLPCAGNTSRASSNDSGHKVGSGRPQPPLLLLDNTSLRVLF